MSHQPRLIRTASFDCRNRVSYNEFKLTSNKLVVKHKGGEFSGSKGFRSN